LNAAWDDRGYGPQTFRSLAATRREFCRVWPWLKAAADHYGPTNTKDGVWDRIANGECQLWTEPKAAVVTTIKVYRDTALKEVHGWLARGDLDGILIIERSIEKWARDMGAARLMIAGRRGWLRGLDGYRELVTYMAKDLT